MASIPQVNKVLPISRGNPTFGSRSFAELVKQSLPTDLGLYSDKVKDAQPLVATVTTEPSPRLRSLAASAGQASDPLLVPHNCRCLIFCSIL